MTKTEQPAETGTKGWHTEDYMKMEQCSIGEVMLVVADGMDVGVYLGNGVFAGLPSGKDDAPLITEKHCDMVDKDGKKGTLFPISSFEMLPDGIKPEILEKHEAGYLWYETSDGTVHHVRRRKQNPNETAQGNRGGYIDMLDKTGIRLPLSEFPFYIMNQKLIAYLGSYAFPEDAQGRDEPGAFVYPKDDSRVPHTVLH